MSAPPRLGSNDGSREEHDVPSRPLHGLPAAGSAFAGARAASCKSRHNTIVARRSIVRSLYSLPVVDHLQTGRDWKGGRGASEMSSRSISVIIATQNAERYLGEALESIAAQTRPPDEIVIVDGRSGDGTEKIARSYDNVRFLEQAGSGLTDAWNQAILASRGDLIAPLDSDDLWAPEKLARQTAYLAEHSEVACVASRVRFFLDPGEPLPPGFRAELLEGSHAGWVPGNLLIRRSLFDRIGLFDPRLAIAADVDWVVRMRDRGARVGMVDEVLLHKRVHSSNLSLGGLSAARMNKEIIELLARSLRERRTRAPGGEAPGSEGR